MASRKSSGKDAPKTARRTSTAGKTSAGFSEEERAAMRDRARELKTGARANKSDDEHGVIAKLAAMAPSDRVIGERLHAIITTTAPTLAPKLWYGMPAYALDGKVVCFFQDAQKFKARYCTLGFSDKAQLDDGEMWPTSFALKTLIAVDEARIIALVKKAVR